MGEMKREEKKWKELRKKREKLKRKERLRKVLYNLTLMMTTRKKLMILSLNLINKKIKINDPTISEMGHVSNFQAQVFSKKQGSAPQKGEPPARRPYFQNHRER